MYKCYNTLHIYTERCVRIMPTGALKGAGVSCVTHLATASAATLIAGCVDGSLQVQIHFFVCFVFFGVCLATARICYAHRLAAERIGDSPIKSDIKLGPQMHLGAESQSEGTIQLVPKLRKFAIILSQRRGGT